MNFSWAAKQNHRMVGVGRDLCGSSSPTLLPKQGHLQHLSMTSLCPLLLQAAEDRGVYRAYGDRSYWRGAASRVGTAPFWGCATRPCDGVVEVQVLRTSGGNGGYTREACAWLSLIPFSAAGGRLFFPPVLRTGLCPGLARCVASFCSARWPPELGAALLRGREQHRGLKPGFGPWPCHWSTLGWINSLCLSLAWLSPLKKNSTSKLHHSHL